MSSRCDDFATSVCSPIEARLWKLMIDDWAIVSISILFYTRINVNCKYKNGNGEIQFIVREIGGLFCKEIS